MSEYNYLELRSSAFQEFGESILHMLHTTPSEENWNRMVVFLQNATGKPILVVYPTGNVITTEYFDPNLINKLEQWKTNNHCSFALARLAANTYSMSGWIYHDCGAAGNCAKELETVEYLLHRSSYAHDITKNIVAVEDPTGAYNQQVVLDIPDSARISSFAVVYQGVKKRFELTRKKYPHILIDGIIRIGSHSSMLPTNGTRHPIATLAHIDGSLPKHHVTITIDRNIIEIAKHSVTPVAIEFPANNQSYQIDLVNFSEDEIDRMNIMYIVNKAEADAHDHSDFISSKSHRHGTVTFTSNGEPIRPSLFVPEIYLNNPKQHKSFAPLVINDAIRFMKQHHQEQLFLSISSTHTSFIKNVHQPQDKIHQKIDEVMVTKTNILFDLITACMRNHIGVVIRHIGDGFDDEFIEALKQFNAKNSTRTLIKLTKAVMAGNPPYMVGFINGLLKHDQAGQRLLSFVKGQHS